MGYNGGVAGLGGMAEVWQVCVCVEKKKKDLLMVSAKIWACLALPSSCRNNNKIIKGPQPNNHTRPHSLLPASPWPLGWSLPLPWPSPACPAPWPGGPHTAGTASWSVPPLHRWPGRHSGSPASPLSPLAPAARGEERRGRVTDLICKPIQLSAISQDFRVKIIINTCAHILMFLALIRNGNQERVTNKH